MNGKTFNIKETKDLKRLFDNGVSVKEIAMFLNRHPDGVYYKIRQLGLKRNILGYHNWTYEEEAVLIKEYSNKTNKEIAEMLGVTESAITNRAHIIGVKKSQEFIEKYKTITCFHKNHRPANKGKKQTEYMTPEQISRTIRTRFKKGNIPANIKGSGYTRITHDGYIELRVNDRGKNFVLLHRLIWEQKYGPIPKGYIIKFKDGNKKNCDINNLYMTSMKDNMKMNSCHNYPKEISDLIHLKGALNRQINKVEKNGNK